VAHTSRPASKRTGLAAAWLAATNPAARLAHHISSENLIRVVPAFFWALFADLNEIMPASTASAQWLRKEAKPNSTIIFLTEEKT
jgi:hypothetical protein